MSIWINWQYFDKTFTVNGKQGANFSLSGWCFALFIFNEIMKYTGSIYNT